MHVPVVAAARLEGHVAGTELRVSERCQVAVADEVLRIGRIRLSHRKVLGKAFRRGHGAFLVLGPDLLREVEDSPALRPAGIHRDMGNEGCDLGTRHAVLLRVLEMVEKRGIRDALCHEGRDGEHALRLRGERLLVPHLSEEDIVVQMGELRCEGSELIASCCLLHCNPFPHPALRRKPHAFSDFLSM